MLTEDNDDNTLQGRIINENLLHHKIVTLLKYLQANTLFLAGS